MACALSEDSDQPRHPPSLIRVFAGGSKDSQGLKASSCGHRRLWSDWADSQADLSLRWAHVILLVLSYGGSFTFTVVYYHFFPVQSNLAAETKLTELPKPTRTHKPSISSFKFPFDSFKSDLTSTLKKSRDKFTRDSKKVKDQKSSGGHSQVMTPPQSLNFSDSVNIDMGDYSSPAVAEKTFVDEIKESTPKCWRTLYHLLELYSTMPETKTVSHRPDRAQLPVIEEEAEKQEIETPSDSIKTRLDVAVEEEVEIGGGSSGRYENTPLARSTFSRTRFKQSEWMDQIFMSLFVCFFLHFFMLLMLFHWQIWTGTCI